ncbi:MAG: PLP-dependent aminotransferase family protein [Coriobacteriia bacterium]|nr:PLP-dependent aminotransferase family protein [Coriobacteriia bacterium]
MITIDRNDSTPFYRQIYNQVVESIETGAYRMDDRLPSIRKFALDLGVSRNTVEQAYTLLAQEGYAEARPGSGYFINPVDSLRQTTRDFSSEYLADLEKLLVRQKELHNQPPCQFDFAYDRMDAEAFPYSRWARISRDIMLDPCRFDVCRYADRQGLPELREQISTYLIKEQDIVAHPEQIVILPTTRRAFSSILLLFRQDEAVVYVDNPGYPEAYHAARLSGYEVAPHTIYPNFQWSNLKVAPEHADKVKLIYTTPANQYPTNALLGLEERQAFVKWAAENNAYIIEDEYCHEFRYGGPHLPSLHALDTEGRVITMGTFSKSLAPSFCLTYVVLPPKLMLKWLSPPGLLHAQAPWQTQYTLAEFMRGDYWYAHLRRLQTAYRRKYDAILEAIDAYLGDRVEYLQQETGLHVLVRTRDGRPEEELIRLARQAGVRVYPTSQDWVSSKPEDWNYVLVGYSAIPLEKIKAGIRTLAHAWFG